MQSLMQQAAEIVQLATAMNKPTPTCCLCTGSHLCWLHRAEIIRSRRMTRAQWTALRHAQRESAFQQAEQARDEENWQEQSGYAMPESVRISKGYIHD